MGVGGGDAGVRAHHHPRNGGPQAPGPERLIPRGAVSILPLQEGNPGTLPGIQEEEEVRAGADRPPELLPGGRGGSVVVTDEDQEFIQWKCRSRVLHEGSRSRGDVDVHRTRLRESCLKGGWGRRSTGTLSGTVVLTHGP